MRAALSIEHEQVEQKRAEGRGNDSRSASTVTGGTLEGYSQITAGMSAEAVSQNLFSMYPDLHPSVRMIYYC